MSQKNQDKKYRLPQGISIKEAERIDSILNKEFKEWRELSYPKRIPKCFQTGKDDFLIKSDWRRHRDLHSEKRPQPWEYQVECKPPSKPQRYTEGELKEQRRGKIIRPEYMTLVEAKELDQRLSKLIGYNYDGSQKNAEGKTVKCDRIIPDGAYMSMTDEELLELMCPDAQEWNRQTMKLSLLQ